MADTDEAIANSILEALAAKKEEWKTLGISSKTQLLHEIGV